MNLVTFVFLKQTVCSLTVLVSTQGSRLSLPMYYILHILYIGPPSDRMSQQRRARASEALERTSERKTEGSLRGSRLSCKQRIQSYPSFFPGRCDSRLPISFLRSPCIDGYQVLTHMRKETERLGPSKVPNTSKRLRNFRKAFKFFHLKTYSFSLCLLFSSG